MPGGRQAGGLIALDGQGDHLGVRFRPRRANIEIALFVLFSFVRYL